MKDQAISSSVSHTHGKPIHVTNLPSQIHSEKASLPRIRVQGLTTSNNQKVIFLMTQNKPQERQQQQQSFAEKVQKKRRYVTPKNKGKVFIQVPVELDLREKVNALARAKNTGTQDFIAEILAKEVEKEEPLVTIGKQLIAEGHVKPYRTKLQILEEQLARDEKSPPQRES